MSSQALSPAREPRAIAPELERLRPESLLSRVVRRGAKAIAYGWLVLFAVATIMPLIWMISTAMPLVWLPLSIGSGSGVLPELSIPSHCSARL